MSVVIGIDLGTSTTEAAVYRDGRPELIKNFLNEVITPSVVGIDDSGNWVIGERARAQYLLSPENTALEIKRKIGTGETISLGKRKYTPVELSAKILEYVRHYVSEALGEEVTRAVISVPAYFNDTQRTETMLAGRMAGFQVERILNEPTAAALSYGLSHMEEESHVLIYDLGGGTFDVTLLEMFDGVLEVKASSGDNQLGGKDFDQRLVDYLVEKVKKKSGIDLKGNLSAMVRIRDEAEKCKKVLSEADTYQVILPMLAERKGTPVGLEETITRTEFEKMTRDLLDRTHQPLDVVFGDSQISVDDVDHIILVGGSTRMPMVEKDIEDYLQKKPQKSLNPDFAVAEGAAIQGGIIFGNIDEEEGLIMTDVNPYTLGVRVFDGLTTDRMSVVIPRNVTIPTKREEIYSTSADYQTEANIEVYQGESDIATSNHFLGEFVIGGIPSARAGKETIRVQFAYDQNGILDVKAVIASTGKSASIQINMMDAAYKGKHMGGREDFEDYDEDYDKERIDVSHWKESPIAGRFRTVLRRAEKELKRMEDEVFWIGELEDAIYKLKAAIVREDMDKAVLCEEDLLDILEDLKS